MKRNYVKPEIVIVPVVTKNSLLTGSDLMLYREEETAAEDVQYSRRRGYSLWDEE